MTIKNITIDGVEYAKVTPTRDSRAVVVVDRGWIFAGNVTRANGRVQLTKALHVFKWEVNGFSGLIEDPKRAKADLRPIADVDIPAGAEVFCVGVPDDWGL
jgi:hypothetical protein